MTNDDNSKGLDRKRPCPDTKWGLRVSLEGLRKNKKRVSLPSRRPSHVKFKATVINANDWTGCASQFMLNIFCMCAVSGTRAGSATNSVLHAANKCLLNWPCSHVFMEW